MRDHRKENKQPLLAVLSASLARAEAVLIGGFMVLIFALLLLNVVTRTAGAPLIWVDEVAVFLMIWVALFGASLALAKREHIAVTLLPDALSVKPRAVLSFIVDLMLFGFFVIFAVILWRWFDPISLWQAGSAAAFSRETFNFIYQEPTVTLGIAKIWFWLILPIFCLTGLIHTSAHLVCRKCGT